MLAKLPWVGREGERAQACHDLSRGADTKANAWGLVRGRGALELGDLRLFKDGGELGRALNSDAAASETARARDGEQREWSVIRSVSGR